jgi:hypothetical protein
MKLRMADIRIDSLIDPKPIYEADQSVFTDQLYSAHGMT